MNIGIKDILVNFLNPYPAVVHRLKSVYRRNFPEKMPEPEEYLNHSGIYQERIKDRFSHLNRLIGCQSYFV